MPSSNAILCVYFWSEMYDAACICVCIIVGLFNTLGFSLGLLIFVGDLLFRLDGRLNEMEQLYSLLYC